MRTRLVAALAVIALSALLPGPVSARGEKASGIPGISVLINVLRPAPPANTHRAAPARRTEAAAKPAPATVPLPTVVAHVVKPADLVGMRFVMYETQPGAPEPKNSSAPCPRATTCKAYGLTTARWPKDKTGRVTINYAMNESQRRPAREPAGILVPAVQRATAQWRHWNSNVTFRNVGTTTAKLGAAGKDHTCADGHNVIGWEPLAQGVVGEAFLCYDRTNRVVRDTDLALNSILHWEVINGKPQSRHSYDIQSILTHELGHWLSLIDLYASPDGRQTMFGSADYGQTNKRTPALGDIVGVQSAYPCGAGDTCPRTGVKDD